MSTSMDQRLNVWRVSRDDGITMVSSHTHDVADPSSMATYSTRCVYVCVFMCVDPICFYIYQERRCGDCERCWITILQI